MNQQGESAAQPPARSAAPAMERKTKLLIGRLAALAGVKSDTVRFYERTGLLARPPRSEAGYRLYDEATLKRLRFIRQAQALGFSLDVIRRILNSRRKSGSDCCDYVISVAEAKVAETDAKLRELRRFRDALAKNLQRWQSQSRTGCEAAAEFCLLIESSEAAAGPAAGGAPARRARRR